MRITDRQINDSYLYNLRNNTTEVRKLQTKLATGKKINSPSDNPLSSSRLIKLNGQLDKLHTYKSNTDYGLSFVQNTTTAMNNIESEVSGLLVSFSEMNNAANSNLDEYSNKLDSVFESILQTANSKYNGRYLFGGTDHSTVPFEYNSSTGMVDIKSSAPGGTQKIRISKNLEQKINTTGEELFVPEIKLGGKLSLSMASGDSAVQSMKIFNADGNEYNFSVTTTKSADDEFDITYSIKNDAGTEVYNNSQSLKFSNLSGMLQEVDGALPQKLMVDVSDNKIQFQINLNDLKESTDTTSLYHSGNEGVNVLNTIASVKEALKSGTKPNAKQFDILKDFQNHLLGKIADAGNTMNNLDNTTTMLDEQDVEVRDLISRENDVDVASAIIELQDRQYNLDLSYKISSMILPKSLLDYL